MEKIIVFGKGGYYQDKEKWISDNFDVVAFLDNNLDSEGSFPNDIPVYNPSQLTKLPRLPIYVMVSIKHVVEIVTQLLALNVAENRIRLGVSVPPSSNEFEEWIIQNKVEMFVTDGGVCVRYNGIEKVVRTAPELQHQMLMINRQMNPYVELFSKMPTTPVNRHWGRPFGEPIDRRYIEDFLRSKSQFIAGDVVEIGDSRYTNMFGHDIDNSYILHVYGVGNTIKGNLATGEGIEENFCDCLICTQTLQFIFDSKSTVQNIHKILKPNGVALITVPGISQLDMAGYKSWGEAWRFTKQSLKKLFEDVFKTDNVQYDSFGNVKTACCFLYGMCQEDLSDNDYEVNDEMYPVILTVVCRKSS